MEYAFAEETLAALADPSHTSLSIRGSFFSPGDWERVVQALAAQQSLTELTVRSPLPPQVEVWWIPSAFGGNTLLKSLRLESSDIGNLGAEVVASVLPAMRLEHLSLKSNCIGPEAVLPLSKFLREPQCILKSLSLANNPITDDGTSMVAQALLLNRSIESLNLRYASMGDAGLAALCEVLARNRVLSELNLSQNPAIGSVGHGLLVECLVGDCSLTSLAIECSEAALVALALKRNRSLQKLDLSNGLPKQATQLLTDALCHNSTLTQLELASNYLGGQGARHLAELLRENKTLTSLNLQENGIQDAGAELLAASLVRNRTLKELNLGFNMIQSRGAQAFVELLRANSTLTELTLWDSDGHEVKEELRQEITRLLTKNQSPRLVLSLRVQEAGENLEFRFATFSGALLPGPDHREVVILLPRSGHALLLKGAVKDLEPPESLIEIVFPDGRLLRNCSDDMALGEIL